MNAKRVALGTLAAAVTLSATGYMMFAVFFPSLYPEFMSAGSATGVARQPVLVWPIVFGMLSYGLLMSLALETKAGSLTIRGGLTIGAVVSFLTWFTADFMLYGISNVGNVRGILVDPLLESVPGAIAGAVVAALFHKTPHGSVMPETPALKTGRAA